MAWKDCLQGKEMRNIHSQKKRQRKRGEGWQQMERERMGGRPEGGKMAEDSGQSDGGVMEERRGGDKSR